MPRLSKLVSIAVWVLTGAASALAADEDALNLQSAPEPTQKAAERPLRLFVEGALGRIDQRYGLPTETLRRASIDLNWTARPAPGWRLVFSDRLDDLHPVDVGSRSTLNSVREAYASWQDDSGQSLIEFGRINVRNGPAYGYNPTDYFRDGALRSVTSVDPLALRENRLGTVMLRGQRVWTGGAASVMLAPKLANAPSNESLSLDLGATNRRHRALVTLSVQPSDKISGQLLAYAEQGKGVQLGASATALLSDATVAFAELSTGRDFELLDPALGGSASAKHRNRLSGGLTYTTVWNLALTAEVEYNGFAIDRRAWDRLASFGAEAVQSYLFDSQRRQDNASRKAYLLYVTQRGGLRKNLDITALVRFNGDDHSRFAWIEVRQHWPSIDLALQWQRSSGRAYSEYGVVPTRQTVQLIAAYYF